MRRTFLGYVKLGVAGYLILGAHIFGLAWMNALPIVPGLMVFFALGVIDAVVLVAWVDRDIWQ